MCYFEVEIYFLDFSVFENTETIEINIFYISRELKNKDTGIDLSIPSYREVKGMLGSSYEYQVMVVSNLQYFKTAKHKESDNVQFVVRQYKLTSRNFVTLRICV